MYIYMQCGVCVCVCVLKLSESSFRLVLVLALSSILVWQPIAELYNCCVQIQINRLSISRKINNIILGRNDKHEALRCVLSLIRCHLSLRLTSGLLSGFLLIIFAPVWLKRRRPQCPLLLPYEQNFKLVVKWLTSDSTTASSFHTLSFVLLSLCSCRVYACVYVFLRASVCVYWSFSLSLYTSSVYFLCLIQSAWKPQSMQSVQ